MFVDQVKGGPVTVVISRPGSPIIVLRYGIRDFESFDRGFEIIEVGFVAEFGVVIADDDQALLGIGVVPFPQRGNYVLAVNSTEGPHIQQNNLAAQIGEAQWFSGVEPDFVGEFRRRA